MKSALHGLTLLKRNRDGVVRRIGVGELDLSPCSEDARKRGCICSMVGSYSAPAIDPPEPPEQHEKQCPLSGYDPADEYDRRQDDKMMRY